MVRTRVVARTVLLLPTRIAVQYATTCVIWHGQKALGFLLTLDEKTQQVKMSAPDTLTQVVRQLTEGQVNVQPKHIMTPEFYDIPSGVVPDVGDPDRDRVLTEMSFVRHCLGVFIWLYNAYPQAQPGTCALCSNMSMPRAHKV